MLANAKPLWACMPQCALKTQILGELAQAARMSAEELYALWHPEVAPKAGVQRPSGGFKGSATGPSRPNPPRTILQPADHVIRQLMLDSGLWDHMSSGDQEMVQTLSSWHGEAARWLERYTVDQGPQPWPMLREACTSQSFGPALLQLVDGAEIDIQACAEDLELAMAQLRKTMDARRSDALRLLGRA